LPGPDDQLRSALERLAPPADPAGAYERIVEKKIRRQIYRKFQATALAIVVFAGTVGGSFLLVRAFRTASPQRRAVGSPPESSVIAFFSDRTTRPYEQEIYTIKSDGTGLVRVTNKATYSTRVSWSPDGGKIAYDEGINEGLSQIVVSNADGSDQKTVTNVGLPQAPSWSPDGKRIAFFTGLRPQGIYVVDLRGAKPVQLTNAPGTCSDVYPAWSPDGTRIAYIRDCNSGSADIFVMNSDGTADERLTDGTVRVNGALTWSPEGTRIAFSVTSEHGVQVAVINVDGTGFETLTSQGSNTSPAWSPNAGEIAFTSTRDGNREIYVMKPDGSGQTNITNSPANDSDPSWQPLPRAAGPSESPAESPSPSPEPSETPSASSTPPPPPACATSFVNGDFDGDGAADTAAVCPVEGGYSLNVLWGNGASGSVALPDCEQDACEAAAAADLDGDGAAEFLLLAQRGASTQFLEVYELPADEAFGQQAAIVADPGAPGYPAGEAAVFAMGGSVTHMDFLTCAQGSHEVVAASARLNDSQTEWAIHETAFTYDPAYHGYAKGRPSGYGEFTVVSTADSTLAYDPTGENQPQPRGSACWGEGTAPAPTTTAVP
jgi:Tol biopolymer transport system component